MTDSSQSLYAPREPVFPRRVSGRFRTLKWWIMLVTLGIYYLTPWIRWARGPEMPDQAVLVDLASRRFFFFWIEIWPHEFYFVAGLLIMAGLGLFLFTSALGRVWCGYACPQTVWTDLMILVERWIEGDRNARVRLHNAPWDARKARLRLSKWAAWLLIGLATGGAWVFYFTDAPTLARDLGTFDAHPVAYATIGIMTFTTVLFGGFMREQVCIYMCPWPRIQAAMMDSDTITVAYREWRGEPRGKGTKRRRQVAAESVGHGAALNGGVAGRLAPPSGALGDCIDCNACAAVCPMGIDIRDGQQLECITCALCIDACDDVMTRIGRPHGLIDYLALSDEPKERAGQPPRPVWRHILRPRTVLYFALWSLIGVALVWALFARSPIDLTVAPVRNPTFVTLADGTIRNTYDIRLRNQNSVARPFELSLTSDAPLAMSVEGEDDLIVEVPPDETLLRRVYVTAAPGTGPATAERIGFRFWIQDLASGDRASAETLFNGAPR